MFLVQCSQTNLNDFVLIFNQDTSLTKQDQKNNISRPTAVGANNIQFAVDQGAGKISSLIWILSAGHITHNYIFTSCYIFCI